MLRVLLLIMTMLFLDLEASAQWINPRCVCPSYDKLSKPNCGPRAAKLKRDLFDTSCRASSPNLEWMKHLGIDELHLASGKGKSMAKTLDYMRCYSYGDSDALFCHFKDTVAPQVALASKSAGLSFAVSSCIYRRESGFRANPKASSAGAKGYIQFMPTTIKDLKPVVEATAKTLADWKKRLKIAKEKHTDALMKLRFLLSSKRLGEIRSDLAYYDGLTRSLSAKIEARKVWDEYWRGTKNPPRTINASHVSCENVAFILGAMKQVKDLVQIKGVEEEKDHLGNRGINGMDTVDAQIFMAGAYNAGIKNFADRCQDTEDLETCIMKFYRPIKPGEKQNETYNYMRSLQNCAYQFSQKPIVGETEKACKDYQCGI